MRTLRLFTLMCLIPGLGLVAGLWLEGRSTGPEVALLERGSIATLAFGLALILVVALAAEVTQGRRALMAGVFSLGMRLIPLWLGALVLMQTAIAVVTLPLVFKTLGIGIPLGATIVIGLSGFFLALMMLSFGLSAARPKPRLVMGISSAPERHPKLHALIGETAKRVGAAPPELVVLGLEPTFYATALPLVLASDSSLNEGETLHLSVPLIRVLTVPEFTAVIGHELGHFAGDDIAYTTRTAPLFHRARDMLVALGRSTSLVKGPALVVMEFFAEQFLLHEREISREREFAADAAGARAATPEDAARALLKIGAKVGLWPLIQRKMAEALAGGQRFVNASRIFESAALRGEIDVERALAAEIPHPNDTHPPRDERIAALGLDIGVIVADLRLARDGGAAAALIDDLEAVERHLTYGENQRLLVGGRGRLPGGPAGMKAAKPIDIAPPLPAE